MNEEMIREENAVSEEVSTDEITTLRESLEAAQAELSALKRKNLLAQKGIPDADADDMIFLGEKYAERDNISFEEALEKICGRMPFNAVTTGIRTEKNGGEDNLLLRKAFGLRK